MADADDEDDENLGEEFVIFFVFLMPALS